MSTTLMTIDSAGRKEKKPDTLPVVSKHLLTLWGPGQRDLAAAQPRRSAELRLLPWGRSKVASEGPPPQTCSKSF